MNEFERLKAEFKEMIFHALGSDAPRAVTPKVVTPKPKPRAKAKARTWVAPRRIRDDHKREPEPNDFAGRTSAPLTYLPAKEIDSMWHGPRNDRSPH